MCKTINKFKKEYQHTLNMIRNKNGEITKERAKIWKEHFDKLLNFEEPMELIKTGNRESNEVEGEEPNIEDVKKAMGNLKNNKAAGTDGIHLEWIKYGGNKQLNRIYKLVRQIF